MWRLQTAIAVLGSVPTHQDTILSVCELSVHLPEGVVRFTLSRNWVHLGRTTQNQLLHWCP